MRGVGSAMHGDPIVVTSDCLIGDLSAPHLFPGLECGIAA